MLNASHILQKFKLSFQEASSTAQWPPRTSPLTPAGPRADAGGCLAPLLQLRLLLPWCGLVGPSLNSRPLAVGRSPARSTQNWKTRKLTAQRHSLQAILRTNFLPFSLCTGKGSPKLIISSTLTHKCISVHPSNPQQGPHGDRDSLRGCWDPPWSGLIALCCGKSGPLSGKRAVGQGGRE